MRSFILDKKGFSLTEVMFVMGMSVIVVGVIVSAWVFTYKAWITEEHRTTVRLGLLKALETIQSDIRLSSATYMAFYPSTSTTGEYTAVSMPLAEVDSNGFLSTDAEKNIIWDKTVIYHVFTEEGGSKTLRRTVFDPRDNGLTHEEICEQLEEVAESGSGGAGSVTDTTFLRNLDGFTIRTVATVVDFYENSEDAVRMGKISFGWAALDAGAHTIRFQITGKNDDSSGFAMGIDQLLIAPSGSKREVEYYNSSFAPSGSLGSNGKTVTRVYDTTWANNNYLEYGSTATGDYIEFTDYYDLWRESSFDHTSRDNAMYWGDEKRVKLELPEDRETGAEDVTWYSHQEAGDSVQAGRDGDLPAYPITIRDLVTNPNIDTEGDLVRVNFKSSSANPLKIEAAYITRRNSGSDGYVNQATSGLTISEYHRHQQLFFKDAYDADSDGSTDDIVPYLYIAPDSAVWSEWTAFPLILSGTGGSRLDYFITFCVPDLESVDFPAGCGSFDPDASDTKYWQNSSGTTISYYITSGSYTTDLLPAAGTPVWSGSYTVVPSSNLYVTTEVDVWTKRGTVESEIFDTNISDPAYNQAGWSEDAPAGTEVLLKARSSDSEFMTGATAWSAITGSTGNPHNLSIGTGRYLQFQATLSADPFWLYGDDTVTYADYVDEQRTLAVYQFPTRDGEYLVTGLYSTWIDDVQIDWPGENTICQISGYIARRNDCGQAKVTIDGRDIIKVIGVDIGASYDFQGKEIKEEISTEIEPRNTGR